MRILHVIDSLSAGGAEKLIDEILPLLSKQEDIKIELLLLSANNNIFLNKIEDSKVKVSYSSVKNPRSIFNIYFLYRCIKKGDYDIVHTHLFPENYYVAVVAKMLRKKNVRFVTTEHNTYNRRRSILALKYIEKWVYKRYDSIISITQATQDALLQWLDPRKEELDKFQVVNNGIKIKEFKNAKGYNKKDLHDDFTEETILLCMVGRFSEQKDQETIIRSLVYLPETIELVLVGDGDKKEDLIKLASEIGVRHRVKFLGVRNDIPKIYKTIDIVIVSSNWEGFGLVAVEGMAAGKPVIASDVPGLSEIVSGYGILFGNKNSKQLSEIIEDLLIDEEKIKKVSLQATSRALDYSIEDMAYKYYNEYKKLLRRKSW